MELLKQLLAGEYLKEVAQQEGWYVEDQNDKKVAGPFKLEQEAKAKCQQLGGDAKGFTVSYVSDYVARRTNENLGESWAKNLAAENKARMKKEKEEAKTALKKKIDERIAKQKTAEKEYFQKLAQMIQTTVANFVPDSDGLDEAIRKARKMGAREFDAMDDLNKACKLHLDVKDYYSYVQQVIDDH